MTSEAKEWRWPRLGAVLRFPLTRLVIAVAAILAGVLLVSVLLLGLYVVTDFVLPPSAIFLVLGVPAVLVTHFIYIGFVRLVERRAAIELALQGALREVGSGILIGGGLLLTVIGVLAALGHYRVDAITSWTALLPALGVALFAGYVEEVLSRGVILRILEESLGTWIALAISAGLFGFAHFGNPNMGLRGLLAITVGAGALLGAAYLLTRRLWLAVGIHFGWNFVYVLFGLPPPIAEGLFDSRLSGPDLLIGDASGVESSILALTLCVAAAVVLLVAAHRKGHFVRPFWARPTEATNNDTMGEETSP
ncbi:MAG: CPBP family intramembrane metalloprotease [Holophagales bacterium]|nr:CPBP family intramembrane metalloprotease [Holophagales bacterium]MYH25235.1 CPBP family intramembrane metalloprotease [Holophagales bacterium]